MIKENRITALKKTIFFCILFLTLPSISALELPPLAGAVNDSAGILSSDKKNEIENYLLDINNKSDLQIAVLIINSLENENIEDYSMRIAENWKLGSKEKNSGVLLLIAVADKKLRIETGYGLEANLTDARAAQIIRNIIVPEFRQNDYAAGIFNGVKAIAAYSLQDKELLKEVKIKKDKDSGIPFPVIVLIIILYLIISRKASRKFPAFFNTQKSKGVRSTWGGNSFSGGSSFGGGFSGGGGRFGGGGASGGW